MQRPPITRSLALAMLVAAGQPAWPASDCDAPTESWQPRSAVNALAERNGWKVERLKIDDGCYEIKGRDAEGRHFKAKIDPATLEVVRMKREQAGRERERERRRDGPAAPGPSGSAPHASGFEPGATLTPG